MNKLFRNLLIALLGIVLATSICFAAPDNQTVISTTQLDDDPTSVTSSAINVQQYNRVGFWVSYDETQVGNSISLAVTIQVSYDGTNYVAGSFMDVAGGATPQTSETISSDGWYVFWLPDDYPYRYLKVVLTATNTDTDDIASVAAYMTAIQ